MPEKSSPSNVRPAANQMGRAGVELHVCPHCRSGLVQPIESSEPVPGLWDLTLRCPECERIREARCDAAMLQRYHEELDRGLAALQREMDAYFRLSFEEDVERFVVALQADAIMPMDFGPAR
jgi:hypothetical protein